MVKCAFSKTTIVDNPICAPMRHHSSIFPGLARAVIRVSISLDASVLP
jgi:hypothetical protein